MPLPPNFIFNQASLQDAVECRRRFQLRYLLELAWPAPVAEPADEHEAHIRSGEAFHRLIHQHQVGLPAEPLTAQAEAEAEIEAEGTGNLARWWHSYLSDPPEKLPPVRYPEVTLSAPVGSHRLLAKYDLVAIEPGRRAVIVDWKTSARRPTGAWLAARLQTRVYRYVLVRAGSQLNRGAALQPEQIEMIYWFAAFPGQPERLPYNRTQHEADGRYLTSLIADLARAGDDDFPMTEDAARCRFCPYRSLCGRGIEAGNIHANDDVAGVSEEVATDWTAGFDFEQVAEVEF
jgi:CRISPR/Cas system-associated exonuclease Cas4 (RecB family)